MMIAIPPRTAHEPAPRREPTRSRLARLRRFARTPKGVMLLVLALLTLLAAPRAGLDLTLPHLLSAVAAAALIDAVLLWLAHGVWRAPTGALLSGLFVALVLDPHESWFVALCTAGLSITSKWLLRTRWSNIFNPAALALVAAALLYGSGQSWWGALPELPLPAIAVLLATAVFTAHYVNKLPMVVAFLGLYFGLATVTAFAGDPARVAELFRVPNVNAALFFAGFMLTDPPTSPVRYRDQLLYAAIVALASMAVYLTLGAVYFLPAGLLAGNAWESGRRLVAAAGRRALAGATQPGPRSA